MSAFLDHSVGLLDRISVHHVLDPPEVKAECTFSFVLNLLRD